MVQRTLRRALAGGALMAALTLTSPSPAHAAAGPSFVGLWNWLAGSWGERITALWVGAGMQSRRGAVRGGKAGGCVDPNGCANQQTSGTTTVVCILYSDRGVCIDPKD